MSLTSSRRNFLRLGAASAAGALTLSRSVANAMVQACGLTPAQTPGPFYPGESQFSKSTDLTRTSNGARAKGQLIYVKGQVLDESCQPIVGANVEIWQACASGRYNNPNDPNNAPLDPNFRYWGETWTDQRGHYMFKTIKPGAYPADTNWMRPPHIHFKVAKLGYVELITQLYFKGDALNDKDLILNQVAVNERNRVVIDFVPNDASFETGSLMGTFDLTLTSVR